MTKPHESVCNSKATKSRLIASLEKYQKWLKEKRSDVKYKAQIEKILQILKEDFEVDNGNENDAAGEMNLKADDRCSRQAVFDHTIRLICNMELLEKLLKEYPEAKEDSHMTSHNNLEPEAVKFFMPRKGFFNENRRNKMAKPRRIQLKNTLENYRHLMSAEKQAWIECQLGNKPENLKSRVSRVKKRTKREDVVKLLLQIEKKITGDILDEIACKLLKKLPKMIIARKKPLLMTCNALKLRNSALKLISTINGQPRDKNELDCYQNFAGIISDFVVKSMTSSMNPVKNKKVKNPKLLKAMEKNRNLIDVAYNLMRKLQ